jgi:alkyl hydroperoxide reductase subunit D
MTSPTTASLDRLRETLPDAAKDIRLNLTAVLDGGSLTPQQTWGVAAACALSARQADLIEAVLADARANLAEQAGPVLEDAKAAAVLMGMNNVFYRFRHMIGIANYSSKPAKLRMNRLVQVATNKPDFELMCLAVSALNGCELCIRSHEEVVRKGGLTEDQVHDAVRVASTIQAAAVAASLVGID